MAQKKTRYNELLGIDNSIRDPDLYQLLGLDRAAFDGAQVDAAFRERMKVLQGIKSPKHKSFIEFLKGELRRAKSTLVKAEKRKAYDGELLEERREQLARILDVVLADGVLTDAENESIQQVAADVGLLPDETTRILDAELRSRGAARESGVGRVPAEPKRAAPAASPPASQAGRRSATHSDIFKAINKSLKPPAKPAPRPATKRPTLRRPGVKPTKPTARPTPKPQKPAAPIVAEYVGPPRKPKGDWGQVAKPARTTGWGKASVVRQVGVCTSCLKAVEELELTKGNAERLADGRLHCSACSNRLVAGLICASCYQRITRADMKSKDLVHHGGRVNHTRCVT